MKNFIRLNHVIIIFFIFCKCTDENKQLVYPGEEWMKDTTTYQGVDKDKLIKAIDTLRCYCGHDGVEELMIIRNGYIIWQGDSINKQHNIWSSTKSVTSTLFGILLDRNLCDIETKAAEYEPLLKDHYGQVSLRHFTTMTSGYNAVGKSRWDGASEDWSATPFLPDSPLFKPGTAFCYWDEAQMMFGRVLTRIYGKELQTVFTDEIASPLQMGEIEWWSGVDPLNDLEVDNGCTGLKLSASQLARFGLLFLYKGMWKGQQIISESWIDEATQAQVPVNLSLADTDRANTDGRGIYGYNWWTNGIKANGQRNLPDAPHNTFYSSGFNNNMCFVVPEWNMVIVRMGMDGNPEEGKSFVYNIFFKYLGKALEE